MNRRRSTPGTMGPPSDRDVVMGPPPVPTPLSSGLPAPLPQQKSKDDQNLTEKYKKLKRRFFELEEVSKHKETNNELQRSGERNVRMREERDYLLERIMELESPHHANGSPSSSQIPAPQPSSSALPRNLLNARARTSFVENLRQAIAEDDADDDVYPILSTRHVGPEARRKEEEEWRERLEEEAREYRKGKESSGSSTSQSVMNYTPFAHQSGPSVSPRHSSSPVSSGTSTRLRVNSQVSSPSPHSDRVVLPVTHNAIASSSSSRGQGQQSPSHSHPHSYANPPLQPPSPFQQSQHQPQPPLHHIPRSQSPEYHPRSPANSHLSDGPALQNTPNSAQDHAYEAGDREELPRDIQNEPNSLELGTNPVPPRRGTRSRRNNRDSYREVVEDQGSSPRPTSQAARRVSSRNASRATRSEKAAAAKAESQREPTLQSHDELTSPAHVEISSSSVRALPSSPPPAVQEDQYMDSQMEDEAQPEIVSGVEEVPDAAASATSGSAPSLVHESPQRSPSPADPPPPSASTASTDAPSPSPTVDATTGAAATEPTSPAEVEASISPPSLAPAPGSTSLRTAEDNPQASAVEGLAEVNEQLHNGIVQAASKETIEQTSKEVVRETMNKFSVEAHPTLTLDIVKVAEAAIAAQNAAKQSANNSASPPLDPNIDPNLDPSLYAGSSSSATVGTSISTKDQGSVAQSSSSTSTTPSTPSSNLSANPYLSLSTAMMSKMHGSPTGVPPMMGMNPYSMYYPSPTTPGTPNTPTYGNPYANPYFFLASPLGPAPGMYGPGYMPPPLQPPPQQGQPQQRPTTDVQRHAKPKRLKAHTVTSKSFSIPMVPRDKKGQPMLPLNVGIMTVINLGIVCMREHFHTERYIFPVGYEVTRRYLSTVDPGIEVVYHCTILDGGDGPKFQIVPSDVPDRPVIAGTATGAWSNIVKQANAIRNRQHSNSVSGPDFFGLGQNTIKHLIQELPNANRLRDYVWQTFVEGGPLGGRHAAVIPALPEEYDASLPIGAYYPSEQEKLKRDVTTNPNTPKGLAHYPQHIVAQAEAQRKQQQAVQQAKQQAIDPGMQEGTSQLGMLPMLPSSADINFQEYQPSPSATVASGSGSGRTTRNSSGSLSAPIASTRKTRQSSRAPNARAQQQVALLQASPQAAQGGPLQYISQDGTAVTSPTSQIPSTFASIMNAYPAPGVNDPNLHQ